MMHPHVIIITSGQEQQDEEPHEHSWRQLDFVVGAPPVHGPRPVNERPECGEEYGVQPPETECGENRILELLSATRERRHERREKCQREKCQEPGVDEFRAR